MKNELPTSEVTEIQLSTNDDVKYEKDYYLGNYPSGSLSKWNKDFREELLPLAETLLERARSLAATIKPEPDEDEDDFSERQTEAIEKFFYRHYFYYVGGGVVRLVEDSEMPEPMRRELPELVSTSDFCDEIEAVLKKGSLQPAAKRIMREQEFEDLALQLSEDNVGYVVPILANVGTAKISARADCISNRRRELKRYKKLFAKYAKIQRKESKKATRPQEDPRIIESRRRERNGCLLAIAILFGLLFIAAFISSLLERCSS